MGIMKKMHGIYAVMQHSALEIDMHAADGFIHISS